MSRHLASRRRLGRCRRASTSPACSSTTATTSWPRLRGSGCSRPAEAVGARSARLARMAVRRETVVVGGGAMGSATAWHLARRGRQVTLLERFGARHTMGASHGRPRNFNLTYVDATLQAMLREAAVLWRELEDSSGASLLELGGIATHGAGIAPDLVEALGSLGVRASMLTPAEAHERWAGIRFDTRVVHTPDAGRLDADEAVVALQSEAARHGGEVVLD